LIHAVIQSSTLLDLPFIVFYAGFIMLFAVWTSMHLESKTKKMLWACCALIGVAAMSDFIEDWNIWHAIGNANASAATIREPSLVKWFCFYTSILLLGCLLYRTVQKPPFGQPLTGILTVLLFASGAVGLFGLQPDARAHLQQGGLLFFAVPAASLIILFKQAFSHL
jgi:hypothetical protein